MHQKKVRYEMINKYGYVRVSTKDQNEDRQLEAMKQLEIFEKNIYVEKISGNGNTFFCDFPHIN